MRIESINALPAFILLYATIYGAFGVASPFWPRFFESRGLGPEDIGTLLALGMLMRLMSGPLIGRLADISGSLRTALSACTVLATGFALSLLATESFWSLLLVHSAHAATLAPITSIADALAVNSARRSSFEYGWVRGSASAAFVLGTLIVGQLLSYADISAIVWMHAAFLAAAAGAAALVPRLEAQPGQQTSRMLSFLGGVRELWTIPIFRRLIIVTGMVYGSHALHEAFAVIRWNGTGIGPEMTSFLWSEAVAAEVIMFFVWVPRSSIGSALTGQPHLLPRQGSFAGW